MQVAKLVRTGRGWLGRRTREVPAKLNSYRGGLASLSLRGARFLACASEQAPQSPPPPVFARSHRRRSNLDGEPNEIATPRQVGARNDTPLVFARLTSVSRSNLLGAGIDRPSARNDKRAWWWMKEAATKSWRRDPQMTVSSLFLTMAAETSSDFSYSMMCPAGHGSPSLRGTVVPKQSLRGMRLPRPFSGARNNSTDYFYPRGILHREGAGRSWALNNTSNIPEVE